MSDHARCDECGEPLARELLRCPRCDAAREAPPAPPRYDAPAALDGWTALRRTTLAYGVAQALLLGAQLGAPAAGAPSLATRLAVLVPALAAPLWMVRRRAGDWVLPWAWLLCAGSLVALAFLLTGTVAWSVTAGLSWVVGAGWSLGTLLAARRVVRGARGASRMTSEAPRR